MPPTLPARTVGRLEELAVPSRYPIPTGAWYHPTLHPEGVINLSTAENTLLTEEIIPILHKAELEEQHLKYRTTLLRSGVTQLADLLPRYVNRSNPIRDVRRGNSVTGPGVGALLAQLIWAICEEGEGVLMTTPYYHDYPRDIIFPARAISVLAHIPASIDSLSVDVLPYIRARIVESKEEGVPIKALLLCNPHNPIPQCYPLETIRGYLDIAREFDLHLISDELFAQSVFPTRRNLNPRPFISVLSLPEWSLDSDIINQIHVLASVTKDLGLSGLKAAILVTENEDVRRCVEYNLGATPISGYSDAAISCILRDDKLVDDLLAKNARLLGEAMDLYADWAEFHTFPIIEANAGCYFTIDLGRFVPEIGLSAGASTIDGEVALMQRMISSGIHINPMSLDEDPIPYRFRFIFAKDEHTLKLALRRLESAFQLPPWPALVKSS